MTTIFSSPGAKISVEVSKVAFDSMVAAYRKSPKKKTGDILVGKYSDSGVIAQILDFAREEDMQSPVPIMVIVFRLGSEQYEVRVFVFTLDGKALECNSVVEKEVEG